MWYYLARGSLRENELMLRFGFVTTMRQQCFNLVLHVNSGWCCLYEDDEEQLEQVTYHVE
jgi:hypothetical protein